MNDLTFDKDAWDEYLYWQEKDKKICKRINQLLKSIVRDGVMQGRGNPIQCIKLRCQNLFPCLLPLLLHDLCLHNLPHNGKRFHAALFVQMPQTGQQFFF